MSRAKQEPPPFASMHRDYDESLTALLVAADALEAQASALLSLGQISEPGRAPLTERIAKFRRAYYGDRS